MNLHADMGGSLSSGQASFGRGGGGGRVVGCGLGCGWRPVARGRFRLICEGWLPQDGLFVAPGPLSNIERADGVGAHSVIAGPGCARRPPPSPRAGVDRAVRCRVGWRFPRQSRRVRGRRRRRRWCVSCRGRRRGGSSGGGV